MDEGVGNTPIKRQPEPRRKLGRKYQESGYFTESRLSNTIKQKRREKSKRWESGKEKVLANTSDWFFGTKLEHERATWLPTEGM